MKRIITLLLFGLLIAVQAAPDVKLIVYKKKHWLQEVPDSVRDSVWTSENRTEYLSQPWQGSILGAVSDTVTSLGIRGDLAFALVTLVGNMTEKQVNDKYFTPLLDTVNDSIIQVKQTRWFFGKQVIDSMKVLYQQGDSLVLTVPQMKNLVKKYVVFSVDSLGVVDSLDVVDGGDE